MVGFKKLSPLARAIGVTGAVVAIAGGATFAALQSQATLTDSSISSASADLKVYDFTSGSEGYKSTAPGFTVTDLVPGTGVHKNFYLKNSGGVPLTVTAHVPTLPGPPLSGDFGFSGYENVIVEITGESCAVTIHTNLQELNDGQVPLPCNDLAAGATGDGGTVGTPGNYDVKFDINASAITGSQAGVGNFNIVFTGVQGPAS